MSKRDLFMIVLAIPALGGFYGWMVYEFGWVATLQFIGGMTVMFAVMGACMAAIIAIFFYSTLWRSTRYAKRLQEAGYAVYIHRHEMWGFAIMCLMSVVMIPMGIWMIDRVWDIHLCIQAGECYKSSGWYYTAPVLCGFWLLMGFGSLCAVVYQWFTSFRPLRQHYKEMQLGHTLDLPRIR